MLFTSGLAVDVRRPLLDNGLAVDAHRPPGILCSKLSNAGFQTFHSPLGSVFSDILPPCLS